MIQWPLTGRISSPFGDRRNRPSPHSGTDIVGTGTIRAGASGTVHHAGANSGGKNSGNVVTIKYPTAAGTLYAMYCHVAPIYPVRPGQRVSHGQGIAEVGYSGTGDGNHVHIECYLNGKLVNPEHYFAGTAPAGDTGTPIEDEPELEQDSSMIVILHTEHHADGKADTLHYLVDPWTLEPLTTQAEVDTAIAAYGKAIPVDDNRIDLFRRIVDKNRRLLLTASAIAPGIDYTALAKAVNDDLHARLAR